MPGALVVLVHSPWCLQGCCSHFAHSTPLPKLLLCSSFSFLKSALTEVQPVSFTFSAFAVVGPFWSFLEQLPSSNVRQLLGSAQRTPLLLPTTQNQCGRFGSSASLYLLRTSVYSQSIHLGGSSRDRRPSHCANSVQQQIKHYCASALLCFVLLWWFFCTA